MKTKISKPILIFCLILLMIANMAFSPSVRIKDLAHVFEARSNQLMGFGLVVGLKNSGDSTQSAFTHRALTNLLAKLGLASSTDLFKSRNVAAVMVTAELPPFMNPGQRIDVRVSSIGDSSSLKDGTLLQTPLQGADRKVYAVCQGPVVVAGTGGAAGKSKSLTVGRIINGAIVEKAISSKFGAKGFLTLVLDAADFTTAARMAYALERTGISGAQAIDAATVHVPIPDTELNNMVDFISRVEDVKLVPDTIAKVVINQRTGTIVIGESVRLAPVAVSHGDIEVQVGDTAGEGGTGEEDIFSLFEESPVATDNTMAPAENPFDVKQEIKLVKLQAGASLSSLVKALNSVGTSPQDLVAIIQALKTSGALTAKIEVI
jgi:flagellar P-ring protein FlgI